MVATIERCPACGRKMSLIEYRGICWWACDCDERIASDDEIQWLKKWDLVEAPESADEAVA